MKLIILLYAYVLIMISEHSFDGAEYYYMCAIAYSVISSISSVVAYRLKSKILFCYAMVNLFAAIINWFLASNIGYEIFNHIYWDATLNFGLIFLAAELMLLWSGGQDAFVFIHNEFDSYSGKRNNAKTFVEGIK